MHLRSTLSSPFGSALTGGLVVAVIGLVSIETGLIDGDDGSDSIGAPPLTRPVADQSGRGLTVNEIYERDAEGVVFIRAQITQKIQTPFGLPQQQQSEASGSGFVIDDEGHILTNAHVVEGAENIDIQVSEDGDSREAKLIGTDPSSDLALLDVEEDDDLKPLELGDSGAIAVGDPVVAIGNPFGLDRTVTSGIVSALQREIQAPNGFSISDVIQTDAAINPGNSGGPLIDANGRVVGINSQIATSGGGSEGVGFAVPIETARDAVDQLLEDGSVERAYMGVSGADITADIAQALDLPVDAGVLVESIVQGGPADEAGIRGSDGQTTVGGQAFPTGGDVIIAVDGEEVSGMDDIISLVNSAQPGQEVTLTVLRDGSKQDVAVALGERPATVEDATAQP